MTVQQFHVTEEGPRKCSAQPGNCPITKETGEQHYITIEEAQTAYEHKMEQKNLAKPLVKTKAKIATGTTKIYAPKKPDLQPVTLDEIHEIIAKYENTKGVTKPKILEAPIVGYSLVGSSLYNLHHEDSDRDVFILTDSDDKKNYHKIFDDGTDIRVFTVKNFVKSIIDRSPANVDILRANMTTFDKESPMYPYLQNLRFDKYTYIDGMESESVTQLRAALMREDNNDKRAGKSVKTALRNLVLSDRIYEQDQNYQPEFSDSQREEFYKSLEYAIDYANTVVKPKIKADLDVEIEIGKQFKGDRNKLDEHEAYQESHERVKEQLHDLMTHLHGVARKVNQA